MNISFIINGSPGAEGSGAVQSATQFIQGLRNRGHKITVFCTELPETSNRITGINYVHLSTNRGLSTYSAELNRSIQENMKEFAEEDIVHIYSPSALRGAVKIGKQTEAKTVITLQAYRAICPRNNPKFMGDEECKSSGYVKCSICAGATTPSLSSNLETATRMMKRLVAKPRDLYDINVGRQDLENIDLFHTYTPHVVEKYAEFGFPKDKMTVIPTIIDERFITPHKSDFCEPYKILFAGRLSQEKGVEKIVPIVEMINSNMNIDVNLTIAGSGDYRDYLAQQVSRAGLDDTVEFLGHVSYDQMPKVFASHDIFLYPGDWDEPFGRVFIESLATRTPIVASDVGSVDRIIGEAGVTCNPASEAIARTVESVIMNDKLEEMSKKAEEQLDRYLPTTIIPEMERSYQSISS